MAARIERLRKLRKLESRAEGVSAAVAELAQVRRERLLSAALARLSDEDLRVLCRLVDAALEALEARKNHGASAGASEEAGARTDLYMFVASEGDRVALRAFERALEDVRMDEELMRGA